MPPFLEFVGPAYTARSINVAADRAINLYPEIVESNAGKVRVNYYGTPGLRRLLTGTSTC